MLVAVCSAKGSPGVTTTALAMALEWPSPVVLAECDPAGADVLAGYGQGRVAASSGLAELMVTVRHGTGERDVWSHMIAVGDRRRAFLLPGVADARSAAAIDWPRLGGVLRGISPGADVIADCGRIRAEHAPRAVLAAADVVVLVSGWQLRSLRAAQAVLAELRAELTEAGTGADALGLLLVGRRSAYTEAEVSAQLGVPVLGVIPEDPKAAGVFSDGAAPGRGLSQSRLLRAVRTVIEAVGSVGRARTARLAADPAGQPAAAERRSLDGRALHAVTPPEPAVPAAAVVAPRESAGQREATRWREPRPLRSPGEARHG